MGIFDRIFGRRETLDLRPVPTVTVRRRDAQEDLYWSRASGYVEPGIGLGCKSERVSAAVFRGGRVHTQSEIDALLRHSAIARRIVYREPDDALRLGVRVQGLAPEIQDRLDDALDAVGAWGAATKARAYALAYGGALMIVDYEDGTTDPSTPLDLANLAAVRGYRVVHRFMVRRMIMSQRSALARAQPIGFEVELHDYDPLGRSTSRVVTVHASRCITWHGTSVPEDVDDGHGSGFWGVSKFDLMDADLRRYGVATQLLAEAMTVATQGVLKSRYIGDALAQGDRAAVMARASMLAHSMSVLNDIVIDGEGEDYSVVSRGAPGMRDLYDGLIGALVAATGMPRLVLLGETPGGMSAEGRGELRMWYDSIDAARTAVYTRPVRSMIRGLLAAREGPTLGQPVGRVMLEWPSLWTPTADEEAKIRHARAAARKLDVDAGVISADEARQDPDLAATYQVDPDEPAPERPMSVGGTPMPGMDGLDDENITPLDPESDEPALPIHRLAQRVGLSAAALRSRIRAGVLPAKRDTYSGRYYARESDALSLLVPALPADRPAPGSGGDST